MADAVTHSLRPVADGLLADAKLAGAGWLLEAMRAPGAVWVRPGSRLVDDRLAAAFGARLACFEAVTGQIARETAFETLWEQALRDTGAVVTDAPSICHRGADLVVDGRRYSQKTEYRKGARADRLRITKLMEAAFARDLADPAADGRWRRAQAQRHLRRVIGHLDDYEAVLVLQVFRAGHRDGAADATTYRLVEVRSQTLRRLLGEVRERDWTWKAGAANVSATIGDAVGALARVVFDGSDQKVTLDRVAGRVGVEHARWQLAAR